MLADAWKNCLTRGLSAESAEHVFALGFALEQMRQNLEDLERCVREWSDERKPAVGDTAIESNNGKEKSNR